MLNVDSLEKGVVIDHIAAGKDDAPNTAFTTHFDGRVLVVIARVVAVGRACLQADVGDAVDLLVAAVVVVAGEGRQNPAALLEQCANLGGVLDGGDHRRPGLGRGVLVRPVVAAGMEAQASGSVQIRNAACAQIRLYERARNRLRHGKEPACRFR